MYNRIQRHQYYLNHKEKALENGKRWREENRSRFNELERKYNIELKHLTLNRYSTTEEPSCHHCGIDDIDVLCIDHINNDGAEQRRLMGKRGNSLGINFYRILKKASFPKGYQVLCANCNLKKEIERRRLGNS